MEVKSIDEGLFAGVNSSLVDTNRCYLATQHMNEAESIAFVKGFDMCTKSTLHQRALVKRRYDRMIKRIRAYGAVCGALAFVPFSLHVFGLIDFWLGFVPSLLLATIAIVLGLVYQQLADFEV